MTRAQHPARAIKSEIHGEFQKYGLALLKRAGLPPHRALALLRAESQKQRDAVAAVIHIAQDGQEGKDNGSKSQTV